MVEPRMQVKGAVHLENLKTICQVTWERTKSTQIEEILTFVLTWIKQCILYLKENLLIATDLI